MAHNMNHTPTNLISLTDSFGNARINYKARINKNYQCWIVFNTPRSTRKRKDLTSYANELLEGPLQPLYKLVYDYSGSRMYITHRKHEITETIRKKTHAPDLKSQLTEMLLSEYNKFRISGAMRYSDQQILDKFAK
jgi:hypothetical protein